MTLGQKIKKFRNEKKLTQKDIAEQLNVSFQTVSKWENDENEPDIYTLKKLSKIFNCSLDCLLSNEEDNKEVSETKEESKEVPVNKETIVIHQKEIHTCAKCGKNISEEELVSEDDTKTERYGSATRSVSVAQTYYHKKCLSQIKIERAKQEEIAKKRKASKSRKISIGWSIAACVVTLVISLMVLLSTEPYNQTLKPIFAVLISVGLGYGIFAMVYCVLSGSYIVYVFLWCSKLTIKFPGLIFSWNLDGFIWLIGMKILFAILGFLIGVGALLLAITLSSALSIISLPFIIAHNEKTYYDDALF